jgi:hypothetical protein
MKDQNKIIPPKTISVVMDLKTRKAEIIENPLNKSWQKGFQVTSSMLEVFAIEPEFISIISNSDKENICLQYKLVRDFNRKKKGKEGYRQINYELTNSSHN